MKYYDCEESEIISYFINENTSNVSVYMDGEIKDIPLTTFNELKTKVQDCF